MLLQVKEFNQKADERYREAVKGFEFGKGGFPYRPMYLFMTKDNEKQRQKGWVVTNGHCHTFYSNKEKAKNFINN